MSKIDLADAQIPFYADMVTGDHKIVLWYVTGIYLYVYPSKIAAETAARIVFPTLTPDQRYALISYKEWVI